jgi:hypothetical protein
MSALGQASGLRLLLFPELGALTSVLFSDPGSRWARSPLLLVLTPALAAVAGIVVSRQLPYGPLPVALVVGAGLLLLGVLRSPVSPALSAGYLPLAMGIRDPTYPLAILLGIGSLVLVARVARPFLSGAGRSEGRDSGVALPPLRLWLAPLVVFVAGALALGGLLGTHLVLYPPLLVIAWETLAHRQHCPWQGRHRALLLATTAAAVCGLALVRLPMPMPQPLAALVAGVLTALLLRRLRLTCPPAFAVALLPLVLPQPPLGFPLFVLVGGAWLVLVARFVQRRGRRLG